tara:strand:- start:40 stop:450 length:411 start_codon:yes stop_codon:yes gene_type:complete
MPIYEYLCKKCDSQFEVMQTISAKPLKKCKAGNCNGKVERLVSASGFILKGSGWYSSDYPSESRKKGWEAEQKAAGGKTQNDSGHTCGSVCGHGDSASSATTEKSEPTAKPNEAKPKAKNPYSGGKRKTSKTAKTS